MSNCCEVIYWKHDDGWDAYLKRDCANHNGKWIPRWFDDFIIEDAVSKKVASAEVASMHILGICLVGA
jgi:hypothetical protein